MPNLRIYAIFEDEGTDFNVRITNEEAKELKEYVKANPEDDEIYGDDFPSDLMWRISIRVEKMALRAFRDGYCYHDEFGDPDDVDYSFYALSEDIEKIRIRNRKK